MVKSRILVVDDEQLMLEVCADSLANLPDANIVLESDSSHAAKLLSTASWDLLITDVRMPHHSGMDLLQIAREQDPNLAVLMMTAYPSVEKAVESMRLGATDYIVKPFLPGDLMHAVQRLINARQLRDENTLLLRQLQRSYSFGTLIGESASMRELVKTIKQVAPTNVDVLITGETGTGKELVARGLHQFSARHEKKFVPVDCGAIPEDLMESEFFGYERGAFTGADRRSLGLMEFADGGTFFLDEIGELSLRLQAKLLRVLQERTVRRVGGNDEIGVDIRMIAATSRDLDADVKAQLFRSDLYYRINVAHIELPPLRDRIEDIPLLVEHFTRLYAHEMGREQTVVEPDAHEILANYIWPGNVRQLQNVVKRMLVMTNRQTIKVQDLPDEIVSSATSSEQTGSQGFFDQKQQNIATFEKEYLSDLLRSCRGDIPGAAKVAQVPRGTLYRLLKNYGLSAADFRK